jgi:hypothetical protein
MTWQGPGKHMHNMICDLYIYMEKKKYVPTYIPTARNWTPTGKVAMPLLLGAAARHVSGQFLNQGLLQGASSSEGLVHVSNILVN